MADVVVTLPKSFGLKRWIGEGDAAGDTPHPDTLAGCRGYWWGVPSRPNVEVGERVYVVYDGRLIGYAPLDRISLHGGRWFLGRALGATAVTIDEEIKGFRGYRYRWWKLSVERPFPEWRNL